MSTHDSKSAREIPEAFVKLPPEPVERAERAADPFVVPDPVIPRVTRARLFVSKKALESAIAKAGDCASSVFDEVAERARAATYRGIPVLVDDCLPPGEAWMVSDIGTKRFADLDFGHADMTAYHTGFMTGRRTGATTRAGTATLAYACELASRDNLYMQDLRARKNIDESAWFVPRKPPSRRQAKRARVAAGLLERIESRAHRRSGRALEITSVDHENGVITVGRPRKARFWDDFADAVAFAWGSKGE